MFVDLKKAYYSVTQDALWIATRKFGIPEQLVDIVESFHEGIEAKARVCDEINLYSSIIFLMIFIHIVKVMDEACDYHLCIYHSPT